MKSIKALSSDLDGRSFQTDHGTKFSVVQGEYYPKGAIARQHQKYLSNLRPGLLVSVSFRGHPVPVVTVDSGVTRLVSISVSGELIEGSALISEALRVKETREPIGLFL